MKLASALCLFCFVLGYEVHPDNCKDKLADMRAALDMWEVKFIKLNH